MLAGKASKTQAHLARRQDTVHLSHDGLITAQIRQGIENKADIETEKVSLIFSHEFDGKPENFVIPRCAGYEPSTEGALSYDVPGNIFKVEECAEGRGDCALLRGDLADAGP